MNFLLNPIALPRKPATVLCASWGDGGGDHDHGVDVRRSFCKVIGRWSTEHRSSDPKLVQLWEAIQKAWILIVELRDDFGRCLEGVGEPNITHSRMIYIGQ